MTRGNYAGAPGWELRAMETCKIVLSVSKNELSKLGIADTRNIKSLTATEGAQLCNVATTWSYIKEKFSIKELNQKNNKPEINKIVRKRYRKHLRRGITSQHPHQAL